MNRSKLEITAYVLKACAEGPESKGHISYKSFLSFAQVNLYLPWLVKDGLLTESGPTYAITVKGSAFLIFYDSLIGLAPSLRGDTTIRREILA